MALSENSEVKQRIMKMIVRSGMPVRTQSIAQRVEVPQEVDLKALLAELVMEGQLIRQPTLLANGEVGYLYDLPSV
jgi:hypothetical protein